VRSGTRSPFFLDLMMMLSTYASMMRPINSRKTSHMHCWKVASAFLSSKGIIW
jgi:hypothetical protein